MKKQAISKAQLTLPSVLMFLAVVTSFTEAPAQTPPPTETVTTKGQTKEISEWLEKLASADLLQRKAALKQVEAERQRAVEALTVILKDPNKDKSRTSTALKIAGILRLDELTKLLLDNIGFLELGETTGRSIPSPQRDWFAVAALIRIGNPAVKPTLKRLSKETDEINQSLLLTILQEVEGPEFTEILLQGLLGKSQGADKEHFETLLKLHKQMVSFMISRTD